DEAGEKQFEEMQGAELHLPCELVLLAIGFAGPESAVLTAFGLKTAATDACYSTARPGVFAAGDCRRGQSLVVWAIAEGREAARHVDEFLRVVWAARGDAAKVLGFVKTGKFV